MNRRPRPRRPGPAATWFPLLGYGARALSEPLSRPKVWRWLNVAIGCMRLFIVARLVLM